MASSLTRRGRTHQCRRARSARRPGSELERDQRTQEQSTGRDTIAPAPGGEDASATRRWVRRGVVKLAGRSEVSTRNVTEDVGAKTAEGESEPVSARSVHPQPAIAAAALPHGPDAMGAVQQSQRSDASIGTSMVQPPPARPARAGRGTAIDRASAAAKMWRSILTERRLYHAHAGRWVATRNRWQGSIRNSHRGSPDAVLRRASRPRRSFLGP
jgi:hypothetical protein